MSETKPNCAGGLSYQSHSWSGDGDEIACDRCGLRIENFLPQVPKRDWPPAPDKFEEEEIQETFQKWINSDQPAPSQWIDIFRAGFMACLDDWNED